MYRAASSDPVSCAYINHFVRSPDLTILNHGVGRCPGAQIHQSTILATRTTGPFSADQAEQNLPSDPEPHTQKLRRDRRT